MPSKMAGSRASITQPDSSSTRMQRNLAEKQRRDKLNSYISELANIVPMVSMATKRLDKTSILRLSAAHLRIHQSSLNTHKKRSSRKTLLWRPSFFNSDIIQELLEAVDGFLLVTTNLGKIMYISQSVEQFLGHQNIEMIGHSVFSFVHPFDSEILKNQLQALTQKTVHENGSPPPRCSFYCRLRERSQPRSEVMTYQYVHVIGHMTDSKIRDDDNDEEEEEEDEEDEGDEVLEKNLLFKAFVQVVHSSPYNELSLTDTIEDEYVTRHSLDGTIIFADHRISTITGHLPHEVFGNNAYHYICEEDIATALFAHKLMFSNTNGSGLVVYKLRTRNQGFVYLKTSGYLRFDRCTGTVDHFVCLNKLLRDEEGKEELKKFNEEFTPHIKSDSITTLYKSIQTTRCIDFSHLEESSDSMKSADSDNPGAVIKRLLKKDSFNQCSVVINMESCRYTTVNLLKKRAAAGEKNKDSNKISRKQPSGESYLENSQQKSDSDIRVLENENSSSSNSSSISNSSGYSNQVYYVNQLSLTESSMGVNSPLSEVFSPVNSEVQRSKQQFDISHSGEHVNDRTIECKPGKDSALLLSKECSMAIEDSSEDITQSPLDYIENVSESQSTSQKSTLIQTSASSTEELGERSDEESHEERMEISDSPSDDKCRTDC